jgi:hypothetical protein
MYGWKRYQEWQRNLLPGNRAACGHGANAGNGGYGLKGQNPTFSHSPKLDSGALDKICFIGDAHDY